MKCFKSDTVKTLRDLRAARDDIRGRALTSLRLSTDARVRFTSDSYRLEKWTGSAWLLLNRGYSAAEDRVRMNQSAGLTETYRLTLLLPS